MWVRKARRLAEAGILVVHPVARSRLVRANRASRLVGPLTELLTLTYGPHVVVADEFADLGDVVLVVIFGSWAARYEGQRGHPPHDVDVLIVGTPDRIAMYGAADRAQSRLGRPVNPAACSPDQWARPTEPFIREIKSRPYVMVIDRSAADGGAASPGGSGVKPISSGCWRRASFSR